MIRPGSLFLCCLLLVPGASAVAADTPLQRFTLVVGANTGGADRPLLKYGVSDAERFARVMVDLGGVRPEHNTILKQPKLRDLLDGLDLLTRKVTEAASARVVQNPILATALTAEIGYEKAAKIAKAAAEQGRSVADVARELTGLEPKQLAELLDPLRLCGEDGRQR